MGNIPANMDILKESSRAGHEQIEHYKEVAAIQAGVIKYGQEYALTLFNNFNEYITAQHDAKKPITISGLIKASGMGKDQFYRYRDGKLDHLLYQYMDSHGIDYSLTDSMYTDENGKEILLSRLSDVVKNALLCMEEQLEELCYTKGNPVGAIFALKAKYNWQDTPAEQKITNNNTLVLSNVASKEEAIESLKLLSE